MYENLLFQQDIVAQLSQDIVSNTLPPALLFSGAAASGKFTAALETARVLSCQKEAKWNCGCGLCKQHRSLSHMRSLILGYRDLMPEIMASADLVRRSSSDGARYLLVRSIKKLLRRFDPVLWEGEERKLNSAKGVMERLPELIDHLIPGEVLPSGNKLEKLLDTLVTDSASLQKILPSGLPISQVRHINHWAIHTSGKELKIVVIDNAERMLPSAANALLKFIEEPPSDTCIILVTQRKSLLLPTIISRLRTYVFRLRKNVEQKEVLHRVFREDASRYANLNEYFQAWGTGSSEKMREIARDFLLEAVDRNGNYPNVMEKIKIRADLEAFLHALVLEIQQNWKNQKDDAPERRKMEMKWLSNAHFRAENLNISVPLILRELFLNLGVQ